MFAFLQQRFRHTVAPLRAATWNGHELSLEIDGAMHDEIALDLDGCFFASARTDANGCAFFDFPFAPSGNDSFDAMPRRGRGGEALVAQPLRLRFGASGISSAMKSTGAPSALAALRAPAQLAPFGVDVGAQAVAIVVPVYNASALVERCLDAVLAQTSGRARLIVIDDASSDPAITPLLARYADIDSVEIVRNDINRGFTASANRGIEMAGAVDVVLLNADTEVGPNWLTGLRRAACSLDDVGTVTAVSDNAGAFSVPELEQANALPACWTFEQTARALWQQAGLAYPALPTGNGFCLYMRRAVIEQVGLLDECAFPQGYGEENDFCQRAARVGFRHLIAGNVLVKHARSASFGDERRHALGIAGMAVLRERWPDYETEIGRALFSFERRVLDWRVRRLFDDARMDNVPKPRVLHLGNTPPKSSSHEIWQLRVGAGRLELVANERLVESVPRDPVAPEAALRECWNWLQLHAIETLVADAADDELVVLCARLGIGVANSEESIGGRSFVGHSR